MAYETEISDCSTSAYIKGTRRAGGICGISKVDVTISNCTNSGTVLCDPKESQAVSGGIVGAIAEYTNIENCTNSGKISAQYSAGGICGNTDSDDLSCIIGCSNSGEIFAEDSASGICGDGSNIDISCSFNTGKITSSIAGGIGGYLVKSYISYCYNTGELVGVSQSASAGGICAGIYQSYISNSYNIGKLSLPENVSIDENLVGGIVAFGSFEEANITDCFYDESCIQTSEAYISLMGTPLPTEDFKSGKAAYLLMLAEIDTENLTFDDFVWGQTLRGENKEDYPVLNGAKVYEYGYGIYSNVSPLEFGILEYIPKNGSADLVVLNVPQDGSYYLMINGENVRSASVLDAIKLDVSLDLIKLDPVLPNEQAVVVEEEETPKDIRTSSGDDGGPASMITVYLDKVPDFKSGTRLMLWDSLTTITPLCEAFTVR